MILETTSLDLVSLTLRIAGVGVFIHAVESLVQRREFAADGLYSWDALKTSYQATLRPPVEPFTDFLCSPRVFSGLLAIQALCGAYLVAFGAGPLAAVAVAGSFLVFLIFNFRIQSGLDGSDQMQLIVHAGCIAYLLAPGDLGRTAALGFIAFQSALSYLTAGVAKARSKSWRSGSALTGIWSTESYGLGWTARWMSASPASARALCWITIIFEIAMPLLILGGAPGAWTYIAIGVGFHIANAVIMGLNNFVWAFLATYPAVYYIATLR